MHYLIRILLTIAALALLLTSCYLPKPHHTNDACDIFMQYPQWYADALRTQQKWGVPISVQMAIMYQESSFKAVAEPPPCHHFLKDIPGRRPTSALGYCQAVNSTWVDYEKSIGRAADRDKFADASDFIGWYANQLKKDAGIQPTDAYHLYLAYHEGLGGYRVHSFWHKPWLVHLAHRLQERAQMYDRQLQACVNQIPKAKPLQGTTLNNTIHKTDEIANSANIRR